MPRSQRLLDLIQLLRQHRYPIPGKVLAQSLGVSLRTLYRDIATLQSQGATIEGEAGVGYVLAPGYMLPPLMFSEEEIEALVLGARWVMDRTDHQLSQAGRGLLAKIEAVLPEDMKESMNNSSLLVGPGEVVPNNNLLLETLRRSIRREQKIEIHYKDLKGNSSQRTVWPLALAFFDNVRILVAWCELREDFRHFRTDHIQDLQELKTRFPRRRQVLVREWREQEGIPEPK